MKYIKVKDKDNLERDSFSNAIVNVDEKGYNQYIENYKRIYNESKKINDLEQDLFTIKNELNEIKDLLRSFLNGSK